MVETQIVQTYKGVRSLITYNDPEHIKHVKLTKSWCEIHMLNHIAVQGRVDGDILDIGANDGQHAVFFATHCTTGDVYAFEPDHDTCALIHKNKKDNGLKNILIFNCAIGRSGYGEIINNGRSGLNQVKRDSEVKNVEILEPNVHEKKISIIKIDVEGMELEVLEVLMPNIKKWHPQIYVETHNRLNEVKGMLENLDYNLHGVFNNAPTYWFK